MPPTQGETDGEAETLAVVLGEAVREPVSVAETLPEACLDGESVAEVVTLAATDVDRLSLGLRLVEKLAEGVGEVLVDGEGVAV